MEEEPRPELKRKRSNEVEGDGNKEAHEIVTRDGESGYVPFKLTPIVCQRRSSAFFKNLQSE